MKRSKGLQLFHFVQVILVSCFFLIQAEARVGEWTGHKHGASQSNTIFKVENYDQVFKDENSYVCLDDEDINILSIWEERTWTSVKELDLCLKSSSPEIVSRVLSRFPNLERLVSRYPRIFLSDPRWLKRIFKEHPNLGVLEGWALSSNGSCFLPRYIRIQK